MRRMIPLILAGCLGLLWLLPAPQPQGALAHGGGDVAITMRGYNTSRTGANLQETILTTSNVNVNTFGRLYARNVDGQIYAQPLYVPGLLMADGKEHNVVFIATQKNKVYAFDADDPLATEPLWQRDDLGGYGVSADREFGTRYNGGEYRDIQPFVGITSTPALDLTTNTLYVVTFVKIASNQYKHDLHAFDLATGQNKLGSPVRIAGSVPGSGADSDTDHTTVTFESKQQLQRSGLALANGKIYIAFAGYADTNPYHGWIFAYDAQTLQRVAIYNTTPNGGGINDPDENGGEGGIWQSGQAPAIDEDGNVYVVSGNGTINTATGSDLGIAFIKLTETLSRTDWFIPYDYQTLNDQDADIGSSGAVLIPGTTRVVAGGKRGKIYVLDRDNMGRYQAGSDSQIVQNFGATVSHIHGSIVYWQLPSGEKRIYVWGETDRLKSFSYNTGTGRFNTTPAATGSLTLASGMPGGILTVSANNSTSGSGIVWATHPSSGNANTQTRPGTLRAYNAETLADLWNSEQNSARDRVGNFAKFNPPLVVDGKVYVGDFSLNSDPANSDQLVVYGLLAPSVVNDLEDVVIVLGQSGTLEVNASGAASGWSYQWYRGASGDTSNPIAGATGRGYTTTPSQVGETRYWVRITNQYGSADSAAARLIVNKATTTTGIAASSSSSSIGQNVSFTATVDVVAPGAGTPTGSVEFRDGSTVLGSVPLDADGSVSLSTAALSAGTHLISAFYSGDAGFTISNSAGLSHTVNKLTSSVGLSPAPSSSVFGQTVAFTATVTSQQGGGGTPTGSVTFRVGSTVLGSATLTAGRAVLRTAALNPGTHSITASYDGSPLYATAGSPARTHTVTKANSTLALTSSTNPAQLGRLITFTVQLDVVAPGGGTPSGSVTFRDGSTVLGTVSANAAGIAQLSTSRLTLGNHTITATYAGSARYNGTSATLNQVIARTVTYRVLLPVMRK